MFDLPPDGFGDALRITLFRAAAGQVPQCSQRGLVFLHQFVGIFVAKLIKRKRALLGNVQRSADGLRIIRQQTMHLLRRFEISLGIGEQAPTGIVDRATMADARQHILKRRREGS